MEYLQAINIEDLKKSNDSKIIEGIKIICTECKKIPILPYFDKTRRLFLCLMCIDDYQNIILPSYDDYCSIQKLNINCVNCKAKFTLSELPNHLRFCLKIKNPCKRCHQLMEIGHNCVKNLLKIIEIQNKRLLILDKALIQ